MTTTTDTDMLTPEEIARRLRVTRRTVYRWIDSRALPAYQPGGSRGRVLIDPRDLEAFLASRRV